MSLTPNDTAIPLTDEAALWHVRGIPQLYPTKIIAEAAARAAFPSEDPYVRYARIRSLRYYKETP